MIAPTTAPEGSLKTDANPRSAGHSDTIPEENFNALLGIEIQPDGELAEEIQPLITPRLADTELAELDDGALVPEPEIAAEILDTTALEMEANGVVPPAVAMQLPPVATGNPLPPKGKPLPPGDGVVTRPDVTWSGELPGRPVPVLTPGGGSFVVNPATPEPVPVTPVTPDVVSNENMQDLPGSMLQIDNDGQQQDSGLKGWVAANTSTFSQGPIPDPGMPPVVQAFGGVSPTDVEAPTLPAQYSTLDLTETNWEKTLLDRLQWLVGNRQQGARLELNPANLGHIDVQIEMNGDEVRVSFFASEEAARDSLNEALPRLREMLEASGLTLSGSDVSDQAPNQDDAAQLTQSGVTGEAELSQEGNAAQPVVVRDWLLNVYA